jgi:hypothetical protein
MPKRKQTTVAEPIGSDSQPPLRDALIRESARWIAERRWHTFATLTFETEVDEPTAAKEFERYVRRLEQRSLGWVSYFAVAAKSPAFGRVHLHAVLGFRRQPSAIAYRTAWLAGLAKINRYDEGRGGHQYIASHVPIPEAEILLRP